MAVKQGWVGRYYEDFEVGDEYRHPLGRTITEADNIWFTLLTCNTNQMHFNTHYAEQSSFGRPLVNSGFTIALVLGMSVSDVSQQAIANLGLDDVKLTHPVFVGDTLYAESLVIGKRESSTRQEAGIVSVRTRGLNQHGDVCLSWSRNVMVYKKGHAHDAELFPLAKEPWPGQRIT
jgi:itaconyl-CoA hydratase